MPRFLALYMGTGDSPAQAAWEALPDQEKADRSKRAMTAWGAWVKQHQAAIVDMGGPLGKTLRVARDGIAPTRNDLTAYVIVEAASHEQAAAMFTDHPHFTIFPGTGVEVLACPPVPEMPE